MRTLNAYGPGLVVLATAILILFLGPRAVRQLTYEHTRVQIEQASNRLNESGLLERINQAHRDIATMVEPSVVYISTHRMERDRLGFTLGRISSGSGWVYDEEGHIVTNAHVIEGADQIEVQLKDGDIRPAEVRGVDPGTDVAVIKVEPGRLHPAMRGSSDDVRQGDQVFAFGSPFDFRFSMSTGIVSGLRRSALAEVSYQNFIQVDAAINPGNSGGPLTDVRGRVIGMNTAIATGRRGTTNEGVFAGIGLAIPMEMIESVVDQIIATGTVIKSQIGITLLSDEDALDARSALGFRGNGVVISRVIKNAPAAWAGLQAEDVITHIDGLDVATVQQLRAIVSSRRPGEQAAVTIWRRNPVDGSAVSFDTTVSLVSAEDVARTLADATYGLARLETCTPEAARQAGVSYVPGVLVGDVRADSPAAGHMTSGSIIYGVYVGGGQWVAVEQVEAFLTLFTMVESTAPRVTLRVVRPNGEEANVQIAR